MLSIRAVYSADKEDGKRRAGKSSTLVTISKLDHPLRRSTLIGTWE